MQRKFFIILIIILLMLMILGIFYYFINSRTYNLKLPQLEKLESISLEQDTNKKVINDNEKMKDIINIILNNLTMVFTEFQWMNTIQ